MAEWVKLPDWVKSLKPLASVAGTVAEIGRDPAGWFRKRAAWFIVSGLLSALEAGTGVVRWFWNLIGDTLLSVWGSISYALGGPAYYIEYIFGLPAEYLDLVVDALGPFFGPPVAVLGAVGILYLGYELARRGVSAIPIVGSFISP